MTEFWIISVPGERNPEQDVCSQINKFNIPPDFKVGTLDILVGLSDELSKLDVYAERLVFFCASVSRKKSRSIWAMSLKNKISPSSFLTKFQWDYAKYPVKQTLSSLYSIISEIDSDLKVKSQAYNTLKGCLQSLEKKQTGSLITRDLGDLVKREQFVIDSEYLATLVVVVPKNLYNDWKSNYETMTDMVVPKSSELIFEDQDNGLWTVTLFKKMIDDFKSQAREHKFVVRDFTYDEKKIEESKHELSKLESDKKRQFAPLFRWLKVNFGEAFSAMVHIKALRVFVESVLRYGLPVDFQAILLEPSKKQQKKLRDILKQLYSHLDGTSSSSVMDVSSVMAFYNLCTIWLALSLYVSHLNF
ncbi:unnamed protein product [Trichobilharzia regenti]|nr:unnamed protein product [Trichobilharzia regenti]